MAAALRALGGHWRRHPLQLLTLVIGLALATGLWTGVQAINAQARSSYAEAAVVLDRDALPRLTGELTLQDFAAARRAGWNVSPVIEARVPGTSLRLVGLDPFTSPPGSATAPLGETETLVAFLAGETVLVAPNTLSELPVGLSGTGVDGIAPGIVLADIAAAQRILETDRIDALLILPTPRDGLTPLTELIPGSARQEPAGEGGDIGRLTDSFHLNLTAFGLLAFAVGLFIVHAAIGLAFEQRRPLFRTLRALGLPSRTLTLCLALELAALTLAGGAIGIVLGYAVAAALLPGVAATLSGLYGARVDGGLTLSPLWWLSGFAMAGAGLAIAGGRSLWQLATLPVLAPAMPRAWAQARISTLRLQAITGVALLAGAAILALTATGLIAGFLLLGALLLGAALLLPPLLMRVLSLGARSATGPVTQWLWADARQQIPGLSLALMALMLALSANIGVSTMVGSFRGTFTGWLDQRLAAELYLYAEDESQAREIARFLEDRVDAVLPIVAAQANLEGAPGEIYGLLDHATYRENWPLLDQVPDVWSRLAAGEGALVNEQLARREDVWTGTHVDLGSGGRWPVLGVYSDYGNPRGQAYLGLDAFRDRFPETSATRFAVRVAPERVEAVSEQLASTFDLAPDRVVNQAEIKQFSLNVFERTFAVTGALNALTLGVAAFALWASLTTLSGMRVPQVAPLWALGLTRARIAQLDLIRAVGLALLTALLAIPVGIGLAWALLAVVNVQAFGWRLPLRVFPVDWIVLSGWALLAAAAAAALPAARLWRMPPADLVKVFAHER
ncbi:ABC transporter permease [Jannaschia aquimarina]|nr:FtsX-like permease family protein [Jannaschia aquimarina]